MDTRLANHLLWRLRHRAEADAIDYAVERGILEEELLTAERRKVRTFRQGRPPQENPRPRSRACFRVAPVRVPDHGARRKTTNTALR
jgi:hypothetical protein